MHLEFGFQQNKKETLWMRLSSLITVSIQSWSHSNFLSSEMQLDCISENNKMPLDQSLKIFYFTVFEDRIYVEG